MTPSFTLTQLAYFLAVVEAGSMTEAAARVNVSQAAISTSMAQLERNLGVQLFVRQRNRTVSLSRAGRDLLAEATSLLQHAESFEEAARSSSSELIGTLRVAVYSPVAPFRLPRVLRRFEELHPGVHVELHEGNLVEVQDAVRTSICEVALTYDTGLREDFASRALASIHPHVLVAPEHPASSRKSVHLADFADEGLIALDLPDTRDYYADLFRRAGIDPVIRHWVNGYETVRSFVAMGLGYGILNQQVQTMTYTGSPIVDLPLLDDFPPIGLVLAWPEAAHLSRKAEAFVDVCASAYQAPRDPSPK